MKTGILLHVHNLEAVGWADMAWGRPERDELGTVTKFVDLLLDIPTDQTVASIVYSGPSVREGLSEGEYTKKYLADRIERLRDFPQLRRKIDRLSAEEHEVLLKRVHDLVLGHNIRNTMGEVESAAQYFEKQGAARIIQIAPTSHAPRCIRTQAVAREKGNIPKGQQWFLAVSEIGFAGTPAGDVAIYEPPHRADDPVLYIRPSLPEILLQYQYDLSPEERIEALHQFNQVVTKLKAKQHAGEPVLETS